MLLMEAAKKLTDNSKIYLASPYFHKDKSVMQERALVMVDIVGELMRTCNQTCWYYSPIAYWHQVAARHELPRDHEFWLHLDRMMIDLCSHVWFIKLPGFAASSGMRSEWDYCCDHLYNSEWFAAPDWAYERLLAVQRAAQQ
jgi:hypothetical protein